MIMKVLERTCGRNSRGAAMFTAELGGEIIALGAVVLAVTQAVKKWASMDGWKALVISAAISILLALWRTLSVEPVQWGKLVILALGSFLESNGIYHFGAKAIGKSRQRTDSKSV
jgi:hypothetical protein